jgi:hypothetical protein
MDGDDLQRWDRNGNPKHRLVELYMRHKSECTAILNSSRRSGRQLAKYKAKYFDTALTFSPIPRLRSHLCG